MNNRPTMKEMSEWLREITAFGVTVVTSDEKRTELTVSDAYAVVLEDADGMLNVTCEGELPPEIQGVVEMAHLEQAAMGQARSAATPALCEAKDVGGKQWVGFRFPLHLDGLTRNELTTAIWGAWKAQELLAMEILAFKQFDALSSKLAMPEAGMETPQEAAARPPDAPPSTEPATPEPAPAPTPEAAPPSPARRFCSSCGRETKPGQRFCIGCGTPLEGQG